jgi:putative transposase
VRSVKEECLSKLILFGEGSLRKALNQFQDHYLFERNHQGKGNTLLFPKADQLPTSNGPSIACQQRLGGLLGITTGGPHEFFGYTATVARKGNLARKFRIR